jgi:hypothetical protein
VLTSANLSGVAPPFTPASTWATITDTSNARVWNWYTSLGAASPSWH